MREIVAGIRILNSIVGIVRPTFAFGKLAKFASRTSRLSVLGTRVTPLRSVIRALLPCRRGGACSYRKKPKRSLKNGSTKALPYRSPSGECEPNSATATLAERALKRRVPQPTQRTPEGVLCAVCSDLNRCHDYFQYPSSSRFSCSSLSFSKSVALAFRSFFSSIIFRISMPTIAN